MILPILAYGAPVLRKVGDEITKDYPNLEQLIANMFETMYASSGVGIAAPQVGKAIRLFIVDTAPFTNGTRDDEDEYTDAELEQLANLKKVFINAKIVEEDGEEWLFNEGCLSIPKIREDVSRKPRIRIQYVDEHFKPFDEIYEGVAARVIQHEYDHIEGKLFTDRINPLRRRLLQGRLNDISKGKISVTYKMQFPNK
ncbi:MAG: peptide deformylase [Bacteroidia bacterium]